MTVTKNTKSESTPEDPAAEEATAEKPADLEYILPTSETLVVAGIDVRLRPLKFREFAAFLRIFTNGLGTTLSAFDLNTKDREALQGQVIGMAVLAIPNAMDEFVEFLQVVLEPKDPKQNHNLRDALENPDIEDAMNIIPVLVAQEAGNFQSLVGKAQSMFKAMPQLLNRPTGS